MGCRGVQVVYKWMYLFLVIEIRSGRLMWSWIESMKSEAIASAVKSIKDISDMGALVWDGARGRRGRWYGVLTLRQSYSWHTVLS